MVTGMHIGYLHNGDFLLTFWRVDVIFVDAEPIRTRGTCCSC